MLVFCKFAKRLLRYRVYFFSKRWPWVSFSFKKPDHNISFQYISKFYSSRLSSELIFYGKITKIEKNRKNITFLFLFIDRVFLLLIFEIIDAG